jgi:DnaJ like chaperone protein
MRSWSKNIRSDTMPMVADPAALGAALARLFAGWIARGVKAFLGDATERAVKAASRQSYSVATIVLAAKLAKVDGPVSRVEIDAFKSVFKIPADELGDVARIWTAAKRDARGFEPYAHRLAILFGGDRVFLENLMTALIHVALADGPMTPEETRFLERVAQAFSLERAAFGRLRGKIETPTQDDPYHVLGVSPQASDEDVKRAWRRLVRVYHPDAVMGSGRSGAFLERAQRKVAAVNAAYEEIGRSRVRAA